MSQVVQPGAAPVTGPQLDNRRVLAALIDLALMVPVVLVLAALFGGFTAAVTALSGGWALYYYFAMESGDGQTIGKRVMKLRVARADGSPLDMGRVAVRTLLRPIDGLFIYLLGLIVMLATGGRRQRLGDLAAGTVVTEADAPAPAPEAEAVATPPPPPVFETVTAPPPPAPEGDTLLPPVPHLPNPTAPKLEAAPETEVEPELEEPAEAPAAEAVEPEAVEPEAVEPEAVEPEAVEPASEPIEPEPVEPEVAAEPVEDEAEQAPEADVPEVSEPADESADEPADEEPGPRPA